MKLHLPKMLLTAVLAACVAPAAWGDTVTVSSSQSIGELGTGYTGIIVDNGGTLDFGSSSGSQLTDGITIKNGGLAKYSGTSETSFAPATAVTINGGGELQLLGSNDGLGYNSGVPSSITLKGTSTDSIAKMNTKGRVTFATTFNMEGYATIGKTSDAAASGSNRACLDTWANGKIVVKNQGNTIDCEVMLRKDLSIETTANGSLTVNGPVTRHTSEERGAQSVNISGNGLVTFNGNYESRVLNVGGETDGIAHTSTVVMSGDTATIDELNVKSGATFTLDADTKLMVNNGTGTISNAGTLNLNGIIMVSTQAASYTLTDENGSTTSGNGWLTGATGINFNNIVSGDGTVTIGTGFGISAALLSSVYKDATSTTLQGGNITASFATGGEYVVGANNTVVLTNSIATASTAFTVMDNGTLDIKGQMNDNLKNKDLTLYAGASLINSGAGHSHGTASFDVIDLKGNATIGRETGTSNNISLLAGSYNPTKLNLNGHTLTKKGNAIFYVVNSTVGAGTLDIQAGKVEVSRGIALNDNAVINIGAAGTLNFAADNTLTQAGDIVFHATGTGKIESSNDMAIVGTINNNAAKTSAFAGTIEISKNTLHLGTNNDHYEAHSIALNDATVKLLGNSRLRVAGDNLSVASVWVAGDGTNTILSHQTKTDNGGRGFYANKLKLDSDVRINANWLSALAFGELSGSGELRAWYVNSNNNNAGMTLTLDSVNDYTGAIVIGKNADDTLTHAAYVTVNIGSAGKTSVLDSAISNYGTLNIGTAAAEGVTASTTTIKQYITNEGTVSLSGDITLGTDMSKYDIAAPGEGGSYSYDENNGFFTAAGSTYYLVKGNADNITLNTQQAKLDTGSVILEKNYDGVVFTNTQSSTSAEFYITKGELTRSALIADTTNTKVTADTKFIVQGEGTLALSNETMDADMVSLQGTTSKVKLGADATLTNGSSLLSKVTGGGTVEIATTGGYDSTFTANSGFTGTTHVKSGNFTINAISFGNKLELDNGVNIQLNSGTTYEFAVGKELILNGTTEVHQNSNPSKSHLTFKGNVSGDGTYFRKGGGTLTFDGTVNLGEFKNEITDNVNKFNGNSTIGTLTAKAGQFDYGNGTHKVTTLDMSVGGDSTSVVTLKENAKMTVTGSIRGVSTASINLEKDATLTHGDATIKGLSSEANQLATLKAIEPENRPQNFGGYQYSIDSSNFTLTNGQFTLTGNVSDGYTELNNKLRNVALVNEATGVLIVKQTDADRDIASIDAKKGNVNLTNMQGIESLVSLDIADAMAVGAHTEYNGIGSTATDFGTISVTESVTLGSGAVVDGNLQLGSVAVKLTTVTTDSSATGNLAEIQGKLLLTLADTPSLTLDTNTMQTIAALGEGETLYILKAGEVDWGTSGAALLADDTAITTPTEIDAALYIAGLNNGYNLNYDTTSGLMGITMSIPEPTTSMLGLVGLVALTFRRRRK